MIAYILKEPFFYFFYLFNLIIINKGERMQTKKRCEHNDEKSKVLFPSKFN